MDVSCHRPFLPGTSLELAVIPTAQASSFTLQYFPYYVWCSKYSCLYNESIECFPGTASKFSLAPLVTIPVAPIITGIIVHFRFHIRCVSIHKLLYFNFFSASFCTIFVCGYSHIYQSACFFFFIFNYYIWPICCNFCVCVYCLIPLLSSSSPLCRIFVLTFLRQTMSLGNTVLQLFCCYSSWCLYR